jgi:hypothetical protein
MLAVVVPAIIAAEIKNVLLEQASRVGRTLTHALLVDREDGIGRLHVAALDRVVERGPVRRELGHVLGREEKLAGIQRLEVALEYVSRQCVIERPRPIGVAAVREQPIDQLGGRGLGRRRPRHD